MSVFREEALRCPRCGHEERAAVIASLNPVRRPDLRAQILDGTFQRRPCPACGVTRHIEGPFVYIDYPARQFIAVFPAPAVRAWRSVEREVVVTFRRNVLRHAPDSVRALGPSFLVRAVFGVEGLAEKIRSLDAGERDAAVEVLKLSWISDALPEDLGAPADIRLVAIDAESVTLQAHRGSRAHPETVTRTWPRDRLRELETDPEWEPAFRSLTGGPYVSVGRLFEPGEAALQAPEEVSP